MSDWRIEMRTWEDCDSEELARITFDITKSAIPENCEAKLQRRQTKIGEVVPIGQWITLKSTGDMEAKP